MKHHNCRDHITFAIISMNYYIHHDYVTIIIERGDTMKDNLGVETIGIICLTIITITAMTKNMTEIASVALGAIAGYLTHKRGG